MPSNGTATCIPCRFSAKQTYTCPYCHEPMTYMGKAFKPPRKSNNTQWRKVELMVEHSQYFGYCRCCRPRKTPATLSEAKTLYRDRRVHARSYAIRSVKQEQITRRLMWKGRP